MSYNSHFMPLMAIISCSFLVETVPFGEIFCWLAIHVREGHCWLSFNASCIYQEVLEYIKVKPKWFYVLVLNRQSAICVDQPYKMFFTKQESFQGELVSYYHCGWEGLWSLEFQFTSESRKKQYNMSITRLAIYLLLILFVLPVGSAHMPLKGENLLGYQMPLC